MSKSSFDFPGVLLAHHFQSPYVGIPFNGIEIYGYSVSIAPVGVETIALLTAESTPQQRQLHPEAEQLFEKAARRLVEEGKEFTTVLHPHWNLPALWWKKME